jgi:hypothetical protein
LPFIFCPSRRPSPCHGSWALPKHRHRARLTRRHGQSSSGGGRRIPIIISLTLFSMSCASCVSARSPSELLTTLNNICRSEATAGSDLTPLCGAARHTAPRDHRHFSRDLLLPPRRCGRRGRRRVGVCPRRCDRLPTAALGLESPHRAVRQRCVGMCDTANLDLQVLLYSHHRHPCARSSFPH